MDFSAQLSAYITRVEAGIDALLPPADTRPARLHAAMRYSLQAGGKRLRPVLLLAAAELSPPGGPGKPKGFDPLPAAVAIECVHTYSLIHDDLPCMDNDDLRRGRPTAHRAFDESTALLAGDALLTHAFRLLAHRYDQAPGLDLIRELATAADSEHLIGGQMEDLLAEKRTDATAGDLEFIHRNKTAALIEAALVMGGIVSGADHPTLGTLRRAGRHLGMAFQIIDDILDGTKDSATLGKTAGKDAKAGKFTFLQLHGLEGSRNKAREQTGRARAEMERIAGDGAFLAKLVASMETRSH